MNIESFIKKVEHIENLPTLPAIAMEVNRMLQDHNTSIKMLSNRIEKDQAIVAKILRLVNSAFFGVRSKISNVSHAITLLGFNTVRNAVVSVSILDAIDLKSELPEFDITDFWKHSVAVAVTSKYIAEQSRLYSPNDCFIGGLLHDIGKIILLKHFQDIFTKILTSSQHNGISFHEAEKEEIPVGHAWIGGYLAKKWQLPLSLVDAIQFHHTINNSAYDIDFVSIVNAADIIVNGMNGSNIRMNASGGSLDIKKDIYAIFDNATNWYPVISEDMESACSFFLEEIK